VPQFTLARIAFIGVNCSQQQLMPRFTAFRQLLRTGRLESIEMQGHNATDSAGGAELPRFKCLDEYPRYSRLLKRRAIASKYWHIVAILPVAIVLGVAEFLFPKSDSKPLLACIVAALVWALFVVGYSIALIVYWAAFRCPRCKRRFGTDDDECWSCGLPRHCR